MRARLVLLCLALLAAASGASAQDATPPLSLKGEWRQGSLLFGQTTPGAEVHFNGRRLRLSPEGRFVFGLDRDEPAEASLSIRLPGAPEWLTRYPVAQREYQIQRLNGLPPKQVNPEPAMEARIAAEAAQNRKARARDSDYASVFAPFAWPAKGAITGVFGSQRILNGEPKQPHYGVDVAGPVGAPVVAPADGVVSLANPDMFFSGGTLYLDHGYGVSSAFLHLSKILVKEGQPVKRGEKIALIGKTGRVTGAHLDWRVNWFESRVDAQQLVPPQGKP
ncbi:M23 family metallopeptidase [Stagnimonas aquatica]|uniref:M23 family metallopeptidase n=1 Tax=Stagnimonas aquatica TaxID=2689987 RepID=A0A3N0V802_9GAMM|nr:M23 family metallopeptidase [Stagnimonas aquatica]ROH88815.1 M23 family metallopeptidase [Stagnimonas aquatica]